MQSRVEDILMAIINGTDSSELPPPQSRNEALLLRILDKINAGGKLPIHICTEGEYDPVTGMPTVQNPEEDTFYLVPDGEGHNLFTEWVYVDGAWELFGGGGVDVPVQDVQVNGTSVLVDGVANVPIAGRDILGAIRANAYYGTSTDNDGILRITEASNAELKAGLVSYHVISPKIQHSSAFYGLAKAAGDTTQSASSNAVGTYTESAKSKISEMLNGSVTVTGSTPSITALPGIRYVCGEVATLDITLPASGIVDVVFESGATATVLTITPPTGVTLKWVNGFDPASLDANATYEINIADGLGVAASWT